MPRTARLVVPGYPHHVTQRGIRGYKTFFDTLDYLTYIELLKDSRRTANVSIWAYCLMPNHVHLILVPEAKDGLAKLLRQVHSRYALKVNSTRGWKGHLWQERFYSAVMDEDHVLAALRYVELNPVRAGICAKAEDWRWSSVHANLGNRHDELVDVEATHDLVPEWRTFLGEEFPSAIQDSLRKSTRTGRPAGDDGFIDQLERETGKSIHSRKRGRRSPHD